MTWRATQAKAKFSEVLDRAESEGPQIVQRRKREFVVMTRDQDKELKIKRDRSKQRRESPSSRRTMAEFFRNSPLVGSGIDLTRSRGDALAESPLVSAWDALAPSFDDRFDITFSRLKGKLRKAKLG